VDAGVSPALVRREGGTLALHLMHFPPTLDQTRSVLQLRYILTTHGSCFICVASPMHHLALTCEVLCLLLLWDGSLLWPLYWHRTCFGRWLINALTGVLDGSWGLAQLLCLVAVLLRIWRCIPVYGSVSCVALDLSNKQTNKNLRCGNHVTQSST
jgi:hypothetical protein